MLDHLIEQKGIVSRKIGEAKRDGQPIDSLLIEMKRVSAEIAAIKSAEKNKQEKRVDEQQAGKSNKVEKPNLFKQRESVPASQIKEIIQCHTDAEGGWAEKWDDYVLARADSAIYHRWAFKEVVEQSFEHATCYLAAVNTSGTICGILPAVEMKSRLFGHFVVSLPYFTYGAVLADNEEIAQALYGGLFEFAKQQGAAHVELRATTSQTCLQEAMPAKLSKVSMVRSLPASADSLWQDIGTKVRAQIKKAQRFDLDMKFGKQELLDDFYRVFAENMRDLGTPVYAKAFFSQLLTSSLASNFDLGVLYFEKKPVACCFLMQHKGMMEIPWASALNSANDMNVNMLMYWEVLKRAISQENQFFDFGRSSKDAGTYRFKKQWGAKAQQLYWYYWLPEGGEMPELNPNNPKYKLLIAVWQKLPVWLTKWIGPPVVKYLP